MKPTYPYKFRIVGIANGHFIHAGPYKGPEFLSIYLSRDQRHGLVIGLVRLRVGLYWTSRSKTSPYSNDIIGREHNFIIKRFAPYFESK